MIRTALVWLCVAACSKSEPTVNASPACALVIVADPTGVSIGTSAGACRSARIGGAPDLAWVETELRGLRSAFADCSPRSLLVAETGPYQEAIALMDVAVKTGCVDVALGDASDLELSVAGASDAHCRHPSPPPAKPAARPVPQPVPTPPLLPAEARAIAAKLEQQTPLPPPTTTRALERAPVIVVTRTAITFRGDVVTSVDEVARAPRALDRLADLLRAEDARTRRELATGSLPAELVKACEDARQGLRPLPGQVCPLGLAILQADAATDMRVIHALLHAARSAGFDNVLFAVKKL